MKNWVYTYESQYGRNPQVRRFVNFMLKGGTLSKRKLSQASEPPHKITALARVDPNPSPLVSSNPSSERGSGKYMMNMFEKCEYKIHQRDKEIRELQYTLSQIRRDLGRCEQSNQHLKEEIDDYVNPKPSSIEKEEKMLIKELADLTKAQNDFEELDPEEEEYKDQYNDAMEQRVKMKAITQRLDEIANHFEEEKEQKEKEMEDMKEEWLHEAVLKAMQEGKTPPTRTPWDPPKTSRPSPEEETPPKWYHFWKRRK